MHHPHEPVARLFLRALRAAATVGVVSTIAAGQLEREARAATMRQVVTGRVCMPDGSPAAGAVVVTSAGGQAVTGADGSFALAVGLPLDAERLEVTAVADEQAGSGSLVANVSFVPAAISATTTVGTMVVSPSLTCHTRWLPAFGGILGGDLGGDAALALTVFDDGGGQALFAGGSFTSAGMPVNRIARWDGSSWSPLGSGMNDSVFALAVYDDGSGPALYAGGDFTTAGGVTANRIAKWNGSSWSAVGGGMDGTVNALAVFDDGGGAALFAGGGFTTAGSVSHVHIAKWNGSSWRPMQYLLGGSVLALTVFDDGGGPGLYAGGSFRTAGATAVNGIARWNGSTWAQLGSGMSVPLSPGGVVAVRALTGFDDGGGPALYAGGDFLRAGGVAASCIAKWDGSSWSALGSGVNRTVRALAVYDGGAGPELYVGGDFTTPGSVGTDHIAKWNGSGWSALAWERSSGVHAMAVYDDGGGPALCVGGRFERTGGDAHSVRKWDGSTWSGLGTGVDGSVNVLAVYDDGGGAALHVGGSFTSAGGVRVNRIAKWDGSAWSPLGGGIGDPGSTQSFVPEVFALAVYDDGFGPALYVAGRFDKVDGNGMNATNVARWNGSSWSPLLGGHVSDAIHALTVYFDGTERALYAGGRFTMASGSIVNHIAKWNGSRWSALGSGMPNLADDVRALMAFDDGGGPALHAGGTFLFAGGVRVNGIAKWDGATWSALGGGMSLSVVGSSATVNALTVHDDGGGPALYAGGAFTSAGSVAASGIAKWDGSSWAQVGGGFKNVVHALTVYDDGGGPALVAAGQLGKGVARLDGSTWSRLGTFSGAVLALASSGDGSRLYAGGEFITSPAGDSYLAKWGCPQKSTASRRKL